MQFIIGNAIMFFSSILMMLANVPKKKSTCITIQSCQIVGMSIGNLLFGSYPGFINNLFSLTRNILAYKNKLNWSYKILIIICSSIISIACNSIGIFVIFPLFSLISFTLFMDTKNIVTFKRLLLLSNIAWLIHDVYIQAHIVAIFDLISIIAVSISIYQVKKKQLQEN